MSTDTKDLKNLSKSLRKNILRMALEAGSSSAHIGGALSLTDLMSVLIGKKLIYKKASRHGKVEIVSYLVKDMVV